MYTNLERNSSHIPSMYTALIGYFVEERCGNEPNILKFPILELPRTRVNQKTK